MSSDETTTSTKEQPRSPDVLFVHSPTDSGDGFRVIRAREEGLQVGELTAVKEGQPIKGDLVKLTPRQEGRGRLFDVEVLLSQQEAGRAGHERHGPAQVASEAYVRNWETVFGRHPKGDDLPN